VNATYTASQRSGPGHRRNSGERRAFDLNSGGAQTTEPPEAEPAGASVTLQLRRAVIGGRWALGAAVLILAIGASRRSRPAPRLRFELLAADPPPGERPSRWAVSWRRSSPCWRHGGSRAPFGRCSTRRCIRPTQESISGQGGGQHDPALPLILVGLYFALVALRVPLGALTVLLGTMGLGIGLGSSRCS